MPKTEIIGIMTYKSSRWKIASNELWPFTNKAQDTRRKRTPTESTVTNHAQCWVLSARNARDAPGAHPAIFELTNKRTGKKNNTETEATAHSVTKRIYSKFIVCSETIDHLSFVHSYTSFSRIYLYCHSMVKTAHWKRYKNIKLCFNNAPTTTDRPIQNGMAVARTRERGSERKKEEIKKCEDYKRDMISSGRGWEFSIYIKLCLMSHHFAQSNPIQSNPIWLNCTVEPPAFDISMSNILSNLF